MIIIITFIFIYHCQRMIEKLFKAMKAISQWKHQLVCSQMNESLLLCIANFTNPLFPVINSP